MGLYGWVAGAVFVIVTVLMVVATVSKDPADWLRRHLDGTPFTEGAYAVALAVIAALLVWRSFVAIDAAGTPAEAAESAAASAGDGPPLRIDVTAARWNWRFDYPGSVTQVGSDLDHPAELVVPQGRPIVFSLRSLDVVHSFWIPEQRTKYDAVPGHPQTFSMRFAAGEDYSGSRCSEFCGTYHDRMVFSVRTMAPDAFQRWLTKRSIETRRTDPSIDPGYRIPRSTTPGPSAATSTPRPSGTSGATS